MSTFKKFKDFFLLESKAKHSKAEAKYVDHPVKRQKCMQCTMWRPPNKCSAVIGDIAKTGWCRWWKLSKRLKNKSEEQID